MYSTSSGRGFLPLVTAAHEISPSYSCKSNPVVGSGIYTSVAQVDLSTSHSTKTEPSCVKPPVPEGDARRAQKHDGW